jgi:adenylate cyclase
MENPGKAPVRVRLSIRWKIILPFMLLALLLGLGAVILINRQSSQADQVRFLRQLRDSGQQAADEVVRIEARLLEIERVLANTEGVPEAVALADAEQLRNVLLQSVVNSATDVAVILDRLGSSLLAIRRSSPAAQADYVTLRGEGFYSGWEFVRQVLDFEGGAGEADQLMKLAGIETLDLGGEKVPVFFIAGPLIDEQGTVFGAVLVGKYFTNFIDDLGERASAHISIYGPVTGELLATDFSAEDPKEPADLSLGEVLTRQVADSGSNQEPYRTIMVAGQQYGEVLTPLVARNHELHLGILGISLLGGEDTDAASEQLQQQSKDLILFAALSLVLVIGIGWLVSSWITRPLDDLTSASQAIATGNLSTLIPVGGSDEIGVLASSFNRMLEGIQQEERFRDMVNQTTTEAARHELRQTLAGGETLLKGTHTRAAMLFALLQGIEEGSDPVTMITDLNHAYRSMLPILNMHAGILDNPGSVGMRAYFGILPRSVPLAVSSLQAVHAGMALLDFIRELNEARAAAGQVPLDLSIGVCSGMVVAGGVEALGQIRLTALGAASDQAQIIARAAAAKPGSTLLISMDTQRALHNARDHFTFGRQGELPLSGEGQRLGVIEVLGRTTRLIDSFDLLALSGGLGGPVEG